MGEKVGSDVLGQGGLPQSGPTEKKRQEMLKRMREEKRKKALHDIDDVDGQMTPREGVPGETPHERKLGEGYDVSVREHKRRKPKKGVNSWLEDKAKEIREG